MTPAPHDDAWIPPGTGLPAIRLDRLELHTIDLPLVTPFETPLGTWTTRHVLLVSAHAGDHVGWGEVTAAHAPFYSEETTDLAVEAIARYLAPPLLGGDPVAPDDLQDRWQVVRGHPMARAGVEGAVLDLAARTAGVCLADAIGAARLHVASGVVLGTEGHDPGRLAARASAAVAAGATRIKLKIHPGWDAVPLSTVRGALPDVPLAADANGSYDHASAVALDALADLEVAYVEEPLAPHDLAGLAALTRRGAIRPALDESLPGPEALDTVIALGVVPVVNLKGGRVGGLAASRAILARAKEVGADVFVGGMLSTCIGRLHDLALAARPEVTLASDLSGTDRYSPVDLVDPPIRTRPDGVLAVPRGPGLGATVCLDRVREVTTAHRVLRSGDRAAPEEGLGRASGGRTGPTR